ncbi:MAG: chemotaxis protein CheB [Pseudomonadota bacterium]
MNDGKAPSRGEVPESGPSNGPEDLYDGEGPTDSLPIIVGIAASAGGLEAASLLVQNLPQDVGAAYIIAQHMSPTQKSLLSDLLARETGLPVVELGDDVAPEPNTIYVSRPNTDVVLESGKVGLRPPEGHSATPKPSADRLFKTLAAETGERCVGIVLSGTGSDGSYGVQAIREAGGVTIAQQPETAKYDGMPASAIATGCMDLTLTPENIGRHLAKILATPKDLDRFRYIDEHPSRLSDLMHILLARTGVDFRDYKENTVNRRIARRMSALGIADYEEYVNYCRTAVDEVEALHRDLLISVTRFFRDGKQFEQLANAIDRLVERRPGSAPLRVWIAGCATGEEAYSVAILMVEALGGFDAAMKARLQVFATDIDARALEVARAGIYPTAALGDIPEDYADTYFRLRDSRVEVIPALRQIVLFSQHNLFQDPPFINLDLVTLRNVMIYFKTALQERVLGRLHYALNPEGTLFLGTSEAIGAMHAYFESAPEGEKLYIKRRVGRRPMTEPFMRLANPAQVQKQREADASEPEDPASSIGMFGTLARAVAPNGFVVTSANEIVRVFGDISPVTELNESSLLSMNTSILRGGLRDEASSLTSMALRSKMMRRGRWHQMKGPNFDEVRLDAYPIQPEGAREGHVLFALRMRERDLDPPDMSSLAPEERSRYLREVEAEMLSTREALQQTVEELQTSNEELHAVNEELQSTNEELQATNEELETSNEELQSTNEELITVNEEMQINSSELQIVTTELLAVMEAAPLPILVIDHALQIRRASAAAQSLLKIPLPMGHGVHLSQCRLPDGMSSLTDAVTEVFRRREEMVVENQASGHLIRQIRIKPFLGDTGDVMGLTVTISDFDLGGINAMGDLMDRTANLSHWRFDVASQELYWSDEVFHIHGMSPEDGVPLVQSALDFYIEESRPVITNAFETCVSEGKPYDVLAKIRRVDGEVVPVQAMGVPVFDGEDQVTSVVGIFRRTG